MANIWNIKVTTKTHHQNNIKNYSLNPKYPTNHKSHSTEGQPVDNAGFKMVAAAILNIKVRTKSYYKTDIKSKFPINNKSHNAWKKWPETQHADISWQTSELIKFWSRVVELRYFSTILTLLNLGCEMGSEHFLITHGRKGLQICMWIYPEYLWNCLDFSHGH